MQDKKETRNQKNVSLIHKNREKKNSANFSFRVSF